MAFSVEFKDFNPVGRERHSSVTASEELFRKVFLSSRDAILILSSTADEFLDLNPRASLMFGYARQQFLKLPPKRVICTQEAEWGSLLDSVRGKRNKWLREMSCRHRSGRIMFRDILPSPVTISGELCILTTVRDASCRELSESLRFNARFIRFSNAVAAGAAQAPNIEEAVRFCLQQVCDYAHWIFAHAHIFSKQIVDAHVPTDIWHFGLHETSESLRTMFAAQRFIFPDKWYSRVLAGTRPSIVQDLETELEFAATAKARNVPMKSALIVPILIGNEMIGVCQYFSAEPLNRDQIFLGTVGHLAGRLGLVIEQKRVEQVVRGLSTKLLQAKDDERRQLARELHDTTAQNLTAVLMDLGVIESEDALPSKAQHALTECMSLTRRSLQELRTLSYVLHPPMLDELGLLPALRIFIEGFSQRSGMHVRLDAPESYPRFSKELEMTLFRVVQEGLTNARRHSGSVTADVRLKLEAGELRLNVENETTSELSWSQATRQPAKLGVGMRSMQERVEQFGGHLTLNIGKNSTVLQASFPLAQIAKATA
jgi:PAS domain S-box-containing protein